jgi:hypothetical protein
MMIDMVSPFFSDLLSFYHHHCLVARELIMITQFCPYAVLVVPVQLARIIVLVVRINQAYIIFLLHATCVGRRSDQGPSLRLVARAELRVLEYRHIVGNTTCTVRPQLGLRRIDGVGLNLGIIHGLGYCHITQHN